MVAVAAIVVLAVGVVGVFADPLRLPPGVLSVLDQRAGVLSMFIGAAGLVVAVAALLLQLRAERAQSVPPPVPVSGERSSSDGTRDTQMRARTSGQGRVHQAGDDHIDFHDGKAAGAEHHLPTSQPAQIVEGDIPRRPPGFQPREQLLRRLTGLLGGQELGDQEQAQGGGAVVICAVAGTPGVGKTMLAASYAWACQAARWQVIAWIAAETADQLLTGMAALADRLGERRDDDDASTAAGRARAWLSATSRPALLVFDNAADVAAVRRWCPATGATRVVITTRNRAFLRLYEPIEVEVFTPAQSQAFLHRCTGLGDPGGAAELATELGHLPLALAQAAAVITRLRLDCTGYLELLRALPLGDHLPAQRGGDYPAGTAEAILLSITQAEAALPDARRLLAMLAVLSPAGVPLRVLRAGDDDAPVRTRELLADLADTCLITFSEDGTAVLTHRLVQRVLRDRATHHGELSEILGQATTLLWAFKDTLPDGAHAWAARAAVEMLIEQTDAVYRLTPADDLPVELLHLRTWCVTYLHHLADPGRAIPLTEMTLADCERVLGADHPTTLQCRNNLAYAYHMAGNPGRAVALHETTLADSERVLGRDHLDTLASRNNLAYACQAAGDPTRAVPLWEETLADCERVLGGDHPITLQCRGNLASAYRSARQLSRAVPLYEATLADCERVLGDDHPDTLHSRNNLASAYQAAGDPGRAIPLFEQTLAGCERVMGVAHPTTRVVRGNLRLAAISSWWRRMLPGRGRSGREPTA